MIVRNAALIVVVVNDIHKNGGSAQVELFSHNRAVRSIVMGNMVNGIASNKGNRGRANTLRDVVAIKSPHVARGRVNIRTEMRMGSLMPVIEDQSVTVASPDHTLIIAVAFDTFNSTTQSASINACVFPRRVIHHLAINETINTN